MKKFLISYLIFNLLLFFYLLPVHATEGEIEENEQFTIIYNDENETSYNFNVVEAENLTNINVNKPTLLLINYNTSNQVYIYNFYDIPDNYTITFSFNSDTNKYNFNFYNGSGTLVNTNNNYHYKNLTYNIDTSQWVESSGSGATIRNLSSTVNSGLIGNELYYFENLEPFTISNTFKNGQILTPEEPSSEEPTPEEPTPEEPINNIDFSEVNENLSKIDKDLQYVITFMSLLAVVILIYIIYKFLNIFFPSF